jgi:ribonuclease BN (tRNA processing enzyme)
MGAITGRVDSQAPNERTGTKVVLLGTGTPVPDPDRSGPATAIVVGDSAYLVDFGPGIVRRAESAALNRRIPAVEPGNLKVAFVTHLHSGHTGGYSDLHRMDIRPDSAARSLRAFWTAVDDGAYFAGLPHRH